MAIIQLLIEAIVVGICTLIFGVILGFTFMFDNTFLKSFKFENKNQPQGQRKIENFFAMIEITVGE